MSIRAVAFDIGGVLEVNPRTGWMDRWASRLGLGRAEFEQTLDRLWSPGSVGEATLEQIEQRTASALGLDSSSLAVLMDDAWDEYVGTLNDELVDYFKGLRAHYKTAMLSNSFVGAREREQTAYGFEDICDLIVYSHEVGYMKPDPRIYRELCERLELLPEEVVLLDDVEANVEGARAVGMRAIAFVDNRQAIADLQDLLARG